MGLNLTDLTVILQHVVGAQQIVGLGQQIDVRRRPLSQTTDALVGEITERYGLQHDLPGRTHLIIIDGAASRDSKYSHLALKRALPPNTTALTEVRVEF